MKTGWQQNKYRPVERFKGQINLSQNQSPFKNRGSMVENAGIYPFKEQKILGENANFLKESRDESTSNQPTRKLRRLDVLRSLQKYWN